MEFGGTISAQVLNEFANILRKKLARDWASVSEAVEAGCDRLWSEDMQHVRAFGRMRISNPFL